MCSETGCEGKEREDRAGFGCCPEHFREMFARMSDCRAGKDDLPDCAEIMSRMREGWGSPENTAEKK